MSYSFSTPTEPSFTADPDTCLLYGEIRRRDGEPAAFVPLVFEPVQPPFEDADVAGSALVKKDTLRTVTDRQGLFSVRILRGTPVRVYVGESIFGSEFVVPDCDAAPLADWAFPYPVRIAWFVGDSETNLQEVTDTLVDGALGTVFLAEESTATDLFVGLGALRSDNKIFLPPSQPEIDASPVDLVSSRISPYAQRLEFQIWKLNQPTAGDVVIPYAIGEDENPKKWPAAPSVLRTQPPYFAPGEGPSQTPDPLLSLLIRFS